jgi:hypothetical protein
LGIYIPYNTPLSLPPPRGLKDAYSTILFMEKRLKRYYKVIREGTC